MVSCCRVPCCLVFSSLGPSVLSLLASKKPLAAPLGGPFGPPGALRGLLETDSVALLTGLRASWVIPGLRAAPGPPAWGY